MTLGPACELRLPARLGLGQLRPPLLPAARRFVGRGRLQFLPQSHQARVHLGRRRRSPQLRDPSILLQLLRGRCQLRP